jgi:AraC family transcriptional regulator, arabinose operon regulatory protein
LRKTDSLSYSLSIEPGGFCRFDLQPSNSQHAHPYWEICVVTEGQGEYVESGKVTMLHTGTVFSSPPNVVHEIRSFQTRDLELFFVSLSIQSVPTTHPTEEDQIISAFLSSRLISGNGGSHLIPYGNLISDSSGSIRAQLAKLLTLQAMSYMTARPSTADVLIAPELQRANRFIEANCFRRLEVEEVAKHVYLAPRTLQRRYVAKFGYGVAKGIRQAKMRQAAHRLLMGYAVAEVAESFGILDSSQFSNMFLSEMGMRPKEFQKTYFPRQEIQAVVGEERLELS